jgi:hypothetical protein
MKDEEIGEVAAAWLVLLGMLFVASMIGLTLAILKPILLYFGIDWNL